MSIVLAVWQVVCSTASAIIANWQAYTALAVLALPAFGLHMAKR